jgi:hypothetical protein
MVVREANEEVRDGGWFREGEQGEAFAFWLGIWGVLMVWWAVYVLDGAVIAW